MRPSVQPYSPITRPTSEAKLRRDNLTLHNKLPELPQSLMLRTKDRIPSQRHITSLVFFFFFQAEDGIRDHCVTWSSDVCSSDLRDAGAPGPSLARRAGGGDRSRSDPAP